MAPTEMKIQTAEHLISEAEDNRSREQVTVNGGVDPGIRAGTVLGMITATSVYVRHAPAAGDGSESVAGVLFEAVIGSDRRTIHKRASQMNEAHMTFSAGADAAQILVEKAELEAMGIIVR